MVPAIVIICQERGGWKGWGSQSDSFLQANKERRDITFMSEWCTFSINDKHYPLSSISICVFVQSALHGRDDGIFTPHSSVRQK